MSPDGLAARTVVVDADDGIVEAAWLDIVPYVFAIQWMCVYRGWVWVVFFVALAVFEVIVDWSR